MYGIPKRCKPLSAAEEQVLLAVWDTPHPVTRRAYGVACMRQRLDTLFGGDLAAAVQALVSECGATPGQLARAAAVIEAKRAEAEEYDSYDVFF